MPGHPAAPPPEQPHPGGRARRGQNRGGGRPGVAHRPRGSAAGAGRRRPAGAGPGPAASRRRTQGRIRTKAAKRDGRHPLRRPAHYPVHRRSSHPGGCRRGRGPQRRRQPARRRWRAANCAPWPPPPGRNTRNTSNATRRWRGASSRCKWKSRTKTAPWPCCAASPPGWNNTMACASWTPPSTTRSSCPTATSPAASCRIRPSACWTPPAPAWRWPSTTSRRSWKTCATARPCWTRNWSGC